MNKTVALAWQATTITSMAHFVLLVLDGMPIAGVVPDKFRETLHLLSSAHNVSKGTILLPMADARCAENLSMGVSSVQGGTVCNARFRMGSL